MARPNDAPIAPAALAVTAAGALMAATGALITFGPYGVDFDLLERLRMAPPVYRVLSALLVTVGALTAAWVPGRPSHVWLRPMAGVVATVVGVYAALMGAAAIVANLAADDELGFGDDATRSTQVAIGCLVGAASALLGVVGAWAGRTASRAAREDETSPYTARWGGGPVDG